MKKIMLKKCAAGVVGFNKEITVLIDNERSYLVNASEYHNNGYFSGVPLHIGGRHLFDLLRGAYLLSDIVSGVVDWNCRKEWLKCFTEEQIKEALQVENIFKDRENLVLCKDCIRGEITNICYACNNYGLWQLYNDREANRDIMHAILDYLFDNGHNSKGVDIINFINAKKWLV